MKAGSIGAHHQAVINNNLGFRFMKNTRPLALGVLTGSIAPAVFVVLVLGFSADRVIMPVASSGLIAFFSSLVLIVAIGLPFSLWLRSRKKLTLIPVCLVGVVFGAVVMAFFGFQSNYWPQMNDQSLARNIAWSSAWAGALYGAFFGGLSSGAFCFGAGIPMRSIPDGNPEANTIGHGKNL